jgi:hypothetical protein
MIEVKGKANPYAATRSFERFFSGTNEGYMEPPDDRKSFEDIQRYHRSRRPIAKVGEITPIAHIHYNRVTKKFRVVRIDEEPNERLEERAKQ